MVGPLSQSWYEDGPDQKPHLYEDQPHLLRGGPKTMLIPKRDDETVEEWVERVWSMEPIFGYPETPAWWKELVRTEWRNQREERNGQRDLED